MFCNNRCTFYTFNTSMSKIITHQNIEKIHGNGHVLFKH